jgi:hypothetical protein
MAGFGARLAEGLVIRVIRFPGRPTGNLTRQDQDEAAVVLHYRAAQGCESSLGVAFGLQYSLGPLADEENGGKRPLVGNRTNSFALQEARGGPAMPSCAYFRRQADICFRLSLIASGEEVSSQLMAMAHDYKTNADAIETDSKPPLAAIIAQDASPDLETNGPQ